MADATERQMAVLAAARASAGCLTDPAGREAAAACVAQDWLPVDGGRHALTVAGTDQLRQHESPDQAASVAPLLGRFRTRREDSQDQVLRDLLPAFRHEPTQTKAGGLFVRASSGLLIQKDRDIAKRRGLPQELVPLETRRPLGGLSLRVQGAFQILRAPGHHLFASAAANPNT